MPQTELDGEQPFLSHLVELRDRLLKAIAAVLVLFLGLAFYANPIYSYLAGPLLQHLPAGTQMIAIEVASPFLTPFKLTLVVALFLAVPFVLYQAWAFIAPGLYRHERRMVLPLLLSSTILFYCGVAFAYYVVLPLVFGFLTTAAPVGVTVMTDITQYLDFILTIFFAFGICFEVPIATILLIWSGVVSREALVDKRPYVIVLAFFVGAVLTPPDVVSQTLLAVPMWLLFELGLWFSRFFKPGEEQDEEPGLLSDQGVAPAETVVPPNPDDR
ncbi:MAG: twin-arginine translocase subunit TatC [Methylococcaceae bacterium]|nr:twin-arginine translocase subunit TatC [Methylococcaceae bacterium]